LDQEQSQASVRKKANCLKDLAWSRKCDFLTIGQREGDRLVCSWWVRRQSRAALLSGHCAVILGLEHARTIAKYGWTRNDIKSYLWLNSGNRFEAISRGHRYGKVYNRNLPKWYKREPDSRIPIVESPDRIHLFVIGGHAGRFSAFIPGWGHMSTPVLQPIVEARPVSDGYCADGMCKL
jgi:hypothetical protein